MGVAKVHCVTRFDTAHENAHRDIVGTAEGLGGKLLRPSLSCNQAFEYAIRDIEKKADIYLADVLAH